MLRVLLIGAALALTGCGEGDSTSPGDPRNIDGEWNLTSSYAGPAFDGEVCQLTGILTVTQQGASVAAELRNDLDSRVNEHCYDGSSRLVDSTLFEGSLGSGTTSGSRLSLSGGQYSYMGTIDGNPGVHMNGYGLSAGNTIGVWALNR